MERRPHGRTVAIAGSIAWCYWRKRRVPEPKTLQEYTMIPSTTYFKQPHTVVPQYSVFSWVCYMLQEGTTTSATACPRRHAVYKINCTKVPLTNDSHSKTLTLGATGAIAAAETQHSSRLHHTRHSTGYDIGLMKLYNVVHSDKI